MKRFFQKSYSWLATLLLTVAFAVSGSASAQGIELPFAFTTSAGGTVDGVGFYMWSADWVSSAELYGEGDASATWGTINLNSPAKNIVKVELTCRTNSWSGVGSAAAAAATVCETEDLGGSITTNGAVAIWQGSAHKLTFSSTDDIDVYKMVVYLEEGEVVKECTVGVDHYADACKPGKHETPFYRYTTLYMQENAATTTWTGSDNCPEGVTLTNEAGQQLRVAQFNTWANSDQLGVVLEENITTPGVYTLHIPEGLVAFESGKFNKEINVVWTIVEPDTRPTKDIVFDFTDGTYTNDGTLSYTKEGVVFTINENRYNPTAQGFRIATDGWVSFAAPEKATIKSIQLLQESSYGVSPDFTANVGETHVYDKTLNWTGDDANVTLTDNYGTCYFTKAIVTLAVEELPADPNEECFDAWKALINGEFADIANVYGYEIPEQDVAGKKPAAVAAPCVEYWANRTAFVQMGMPWETVNAFLEQLYYTTIVDDYAYAQALLEAYNAAEVVPEIVVPSDKDKYTIKLNGTDYYFTTTEVKDNNVTTYSISATPEYFYIEPSGNGYTIKSADTDKWVGYDVISTWDFSNDEKVWTIGSLEGEPTTIYKNGSKGFGVDNSYEGAGVYTDKSNQYWVIEKLAGGEVEPTTTFKGEVTANLASVSSLEELEGIQLTFVDAEQVSLLDEVGDGIYVQNEDGSEFYAIWHPGFGGTYEVNGNVVTLYNFLTDNSDGYFNELPTGKSALYFEDYGTFDVNNADADWDGYFKTFSVAFEGAPAPVPFELVFRNNNVVCENGKKVEANEAGIGADFYLVNEGLTAVGKTATLYKDGNAMSFVMTLVDGTAISFLGGSSLITEPGTYTLEVPEGTYVDAAGNPSIAFYGQWVVIQKDEPVVDPTTKDKYTIKLSGTDYYFTTTEVKDNSVTTYSISATPEYFYIEPSGNGYTIKSADTDKWVGYDVISTWDFSNDEKVWQIGSLEGEPTLIYKNGSKGFGVDNRFEGAGVYTDKSNQYWVIEKVVETEPTEWNGNVLYPETAANLDDLLSYTVEFEEATTVEASGYDVLAAIYDANGEPYAIALANGIFDVFGSISFEGSKATVNFMKISDLTAAAQSNAKAAAARIGGFIQPAGKASVVFAGKSFKVDGELVYDILQKDYELGENGVPTGIDTIVTNGNDSIYDLNGRRVNSVRSGLYIKNGVKVLY